MASDGFLNPKAYDRDAEDLDSTFDNDNEKSLNGRDSAETARHSTDILREEEDTEKLVAGNTRRALTEKMFASKSRLRRDESKPFQSVMNPQRKGVNVADMDDEEGELLWSMKPGEDSEKEDDRRSIRDWEGDRVGRSKQAGQNVRKAKFPRSFRTPLIIVSTIVLILLFLALLTAAYHYRSTSHLSNAAVDTSKLLSNGTSLFAPTTILLSIDGFRASFLSLNITPTLRSFIDNGISPPYMLPSFPSLTFPNHYTLVTGLYPESHGIVGNTFWDPELSEEFHYTDPARSMQEKWWKGGEPLWVTAEKQGVISAVHMWPGSEAGIGGEFDAKYVDKYNGSEILGKKVDRILGLLDLPAPWDVAGREDMTRPQFIAAYVPDVDADGHRYGPNSTEITKTIARVDDMLAMLFAGLEYRNLTDVVNVVVVSDHGMATTDTSRLIQLDDLIDLELVAHIDGWPLYGLRPKKDEDIQPIYQSLVQEAKINPNFDVYLRDSNMPERYHFRNNTRIAPLWIVPKPGWAIVTKDGFDVEAAKKSGAIYHPRGLHGYDHEHPLMRAIFVARGPAFPHTPGSRMDVFQNIEVYNIVCDSLGISPHANNGTLRLPLKPVGLHGDEGAPVEDVPLDPEEAEVNPFIAPVPVFSSLPDVQSNASIEMATSMTEPAGIPTASEPMEAHYDTPAPVPTRPVVNDDGSKNENDQQTGEDATVRAWVSGILRGAKEWIDELLHGAKNKGDEESPKNAARGN